MLSATSTKSLFCMPIALDTLTEVAVTLPLTMPRAVSLKAWLPVMNTRRSEPLAPPPSTITAGASTIALRPAVPSMNPNGAGQGCPAGTGKNVLGAGTVGVGALVAAFKTQPKAGLN